MSVYSTFTDYINNLLKPQFSISRHWYTKEMCGWEETTYMFFKYFSMNVWYSAKALIGIQLLGMINTKAVIFQWDRSSYFIYYWICSLSPNHSFTIYWIQGQFHTFLKRTHQLWIYLKDLVCSDNNKSRTKLISLYYIM